MDPLGTAQAIVDVCVLIYQQVELVEANKQQCKRLAERIKIIESAIKELIARKLSVPGESGPLSGESLSYGPALASLEMTLKDALALVAQFSPPKPVEKKSNKFSLLSGKKWAVRMMTARFDADDFADIYEKLGEDLSQATLGLSVQHLFDQEQDREDRQQDHKALLANQAAILQANQESKEGIQKLNMSAAEQKQVIEQQHASMMQWLQEKLDPKSKKKADVSEKLLTPFHQLDVDGILAKGSFGHVYLGRWLKQEVAIKMLEGELTEVERAEFVREVTIMKQLRSDFIVPLYAVCDEPKRACLVMKYMANGSLRSLLDDKGRSLILQQKEQLIMDAALGLHYLHSQGVMHRDFKSDNVLIDGEGRARLTDFGLSKRAEASHGTSIGKQTLDIQWMAPEILRSGSNRAFTNAADVYSFGVVVWEVLTGKKPYAGLSEFEVSNQIKVFEHPPIISDDIPAPYQRLLRACWHKDRWSRPSMGEVVELLRECQTPVAKAETVSHAQPAAGGVAGAQPGFWSAPRSGSSAMLAESAPAIAPAEGEVFYLAAKAYDQEKNDPKVIENYQQAAALGYAKAKTDLGMFYMQGSKGLAQDKQRAHQLLTEAAKGGHARGMRSLAYQLEMGDGVKQDIPLARHWYAEAAKLGDAFAGQKVQQFSAAPPLPAMGHG